MAAVINLENLVAAILDSVEEAQNMVQRQSISRITEYFDKDGRPLFLDLRLPALHGDDDGGKAEQIHRIPLLALVPLTALKIKDMRVKFQVDMSSVGRLKRHMETRKSAMAEGPLGVDSEADKRLRITENAAHRVALKLGSGIFRRKSQTAQIDITFEGGEPAEGVMKVGDLLLKLI